MTGDFNLEKQLYQTEVENEATRLIQDGKAAPYDALILAHSIVQERRQRKHQKSVTAQGTEGGHG